MKIVIFLFIYMGILNFTCAASRINIGGFYDPIPSGSQFYLQMPRDHVVTGVLRGIGHRVPTWVTLLGRRNYLEHVYIRLPNGYGLSSRLNETLHPANDITVHGFRCYIPITNNVILTASLEPYNYYNQQFSSFPQVFVRVPHQDGTVYMGILHQGYTFPDNILH